jgi:multiple sugar transport system ATP-binding protein
MAGVRMENIVKRFGKVSVVEGFNLDIKDEEFMVLVGPSGCGKSTALRMIAGLEEVTAGTLYIGEKVVNDLPPKDRDIAMVFQSYALYPHMTVRENIEFGLKIRKVPQDQINKLVDEAATILDIKHLLDRKPKQLSGGQRQRVALGRAIVRKPAVFLFDEPLSNLDAKLRVQMRAEITKLQQRLKTTAVYVTHDQVEAMTMGHRIAVMNAGKLQQVGTPLALYDKPANVFVAQFIGTPPMNLIKGVIADGGANIATPKYIIPVPKSLRPLTEGKVGKNVVFGIRPENVLQADKSAHGESHRISVEVVIVEPLGHEVVIYGKLGDDLIVAKLEPHSIPKMGEKCDLVIELEEMHLFDAETEKRIVAEEVKQ